MKKTKLISAVAIMLAAGSMLFTSCDFLNPPEDNKTEQGGNQDDDKKDQDDEKTSGYKGELITELEVSKTYFGPGWAETTEGVEAKVEGNKITYVIPGATYEEWQAQLFLSTNGCVESGKYYDVSYTLTPSAALARYTFKFDSDAEMVYKNNLTAEAAAKVEHFYINPTEPVENITFVYDFGGNAAAVTVEIADLKLKEITKDEYDTATYVPPVSGTKNEVLFAQNTDDVTVALNDALEAWWDNGTGLTYVTDTETFAGLTVKKCSAGVAGGCFGIVLSTPVTFKAGAKLQMDVYSAENFKVKPVEPDAEREITVTPNEWTTVTADLGDKDGTLTKFGIIVTEADQLIYIKDVRIIDNE